MAKICKLFLLLVFTGFQVSAQAWLPGYNYRKKITIHKEFVAGAVNLENFPLLVALEDPDLRYVAGDCSGNKISGSKGRDFAFTLVTAAATPLSYQLDHYEAASGKLLSWVRLPSLAAAGTATAATEIYLYYGSNNIHFPNAAAAQFTWNNDQDRIWHMNAAPSGVPIENAARSVAAEALRPSNNITASNYVFGKIGSAIQLNGSNQQLSAGKINSTNFFMSCWIKFTAVNREQVILSTDSAAFGGYVLKLEASGRLSQETRTNSSTSVKLSTLIMVPNRWYHLTSQSYQGRRDIYIDGVNYAVGLGSFASKLGGSLVVGSSKVQDKYFGGIIDELRIQTFNASPEWIMTNYINQRDPAAFYAVSAEESNVELLRTGMVFSNVLNQSWAEPSNWSSKEVPENYEQVIIGPGAKLRDGIPEGLSLNRLTLERDAIMLLEQPMEVLCDSRLDSGARLSINEGAYLQLDASLINHGLLESNAEAQSGGLRFAGAASQFVSGSGHIAVQELLLDKASTSAVLKLEQPVDVFGYVQTKMGVLNSNGHLTLKHTGTAKQGFLWPISTPPEAAVIGEVNVEQHVAGAFPAPATARGWRLWSSPVYHGSGAGLSYYHLFDLKAALFVTGPGGMRNDFDDSPQNGHTIYTHNQALTGTLSQKYSGIPEMNTTVDVGRGIYVFSRGDRLVPDAYARQVQTAPFESPGSYTIKHKGLLFQESLHLELQNRNMGEPGDGFHLLGNPYAAVLSWSDLQRENLSPYVWKFNPLNNAYDVTDDPNTRIKAAEGFFVKVLNGQGRGSIDFSPRHADETISARSNRRLATVEHHATQHAADGKIRVVLAREAFEQQYTLVLSTLGNNDVDDRDATALGVGYVSIAGLAGAETKLSVDTRAKPDRRLLEVPLYVKGYVTGKYQLRISGIGTLEAGTMLILADRYLRTQKVLSEDQVYEFDLNTAVAESFGEHRFVLMLKPSKLELQPETDTAGEELEVLIYPNPFYSSFELKLPGIVRFRMELRLRDLMGRLLLRRNFGWLNGAEVLQVDTPGIGSGLYLVELINLDTNRPVKTSRIIKR